MEQRNLMAVYQSVDVPKSIPKVGTTSSELVITDTFVDPIVDINVKLSISHTYDGDLRVSLQSPKGDLVNLFAFIGSSRDNFMPANCRY